MESSDKIDKLIHDCYVELFKNAEPSADFDELVENATINERGQKEIPFMDYEIDPELHDEIVEKYTKKVTPKYKQQAFKTTIMLGCGPKYKTKNKEYENKSI